MTSRQTKEKTLSDVFTLDKAEFCGKAATAILSSGVLAGMQAAVLTELSYFPWQSFVTSLGSKAAGLLRTNLDEMLISILKLYQELVEYADMSKYPPGTTSMVPLVERTIKAEYHPYLKIVFREMEKDVVFDVVLKLEVKSCVLKIEDGRIRAIQAGTLVGSGTISVFEVNLANQELSPIELPGLVKFGDGISILPGQTHRPANAWAARTA
jgi:hypothetical protein